MLEELGLDRRNPFVLNLINGLKDKNKPIGLDEFIDTIASRVGETKTKDGIRRIFALFDKDENGVIDFEEFKGIAKQLHDAINDDDIHEMLHSTHINHKTSSNEGFTFDEFYSIVSKFNNKWSRPYLSKIISSYHQFIRLFYKDTFIIIVIKSLSWTNCLTFIWWINY